MLTLTLGNISILCNSRCAHIAFHIFVKSSLLNCGVPLWLMDPTHILQGFIVL